MQTVTFKVESLRTIPEPIADRVTKRHIAIVNVKDLPSDFPTETNPREQNLGTKVAKRIKNSLSNNPLQTFHLLNRGILISADTVKFNNSTNMLTLTFTDSDVHGNIDGGHTYKIILQNRSKLQEDQFVTLEILTGIESFFESLASARNTSVQVQDKSIAELEGKFEIIKDALANEPFAHKIGYYENASDKDIDITDVLAILTMFNIDRFTDSNTHPITAFSSKKKCVDYYLEDYNKGENNPFRKMVNIIPDIFRLYDHIESNMPQFYNSKDGGGKYGRIKGVVYKERAFHERPFSASERMEYESPNGFIYPIVAAFRALVTENPQTGYYEWKKGADPIQYFNEIGANMVVATVERSRTLGNNPQSVGKDSGHWKQLYSEVELSYLRDMLQLQQN